MADERKSFTPNNGDGHRELSHASVFTVGAPSFVSKNVGDLWDSSLGETHCRTTAALPDGKRFCMFRTMLYADEFRSKSAVFSKEEGVLHLSPIGLQVRPRQSQTRTYALSLTTAAVFTNAVNDQLIDGLISSSIDGFECVGAFGK